MPPEPIRVMRIIARLNVGGPAIHVSLLTAGLRDEAFQSTLVAGQIGADEGDMSDLAHELNIQPVTITTMGREIKPLNDVRTFFTLLRLMRQHRPHIVHTHTAKAGFVGRFAAWLSGVPVIVHTFHGHVFRGYFGRAKTLLFLWLERLSALYSAAILTISDGLRDDLLGYRIAPAQKIRVVPLGLKLLSLTDLDDYRGHLREELGCSTADRLVGIVGRLVPVKNHRLFLRAAAKVRQHMPRAHFVIVGDGETRPELEALVDEMGLRDVVSFTGWRRDLPVIYADLDVMVIASLNEGTPVSIIEAMAAGVPVVATQVGGIPDLLKGGELGTMVPSEDADAMAEAIMRVLENPTPHTDRARKHALERYDAERLIADMRDLYLELLARKEVTR